MKRCPECRRDYHDETLLYCLDDGTALVEGPASKDEPATAIISEPGQVVRGLARPTDQSELHTAILESPATADVSDTTPAHSIFDRRLLIAPIALALIMVAVFFTYRYYNSAGAGEIRSIAVLPFQNRSSDADSEYLSDGLAESLIYRLSQIPELRVIPRSSVFRYKGQEVDAEKVGNELGVDAVLSGRLIQRGENLTISVDLVDIRNKKTLWGEQFERKMSDLLATQREIASSIAEKLQLKLSGRGLQGLTKRFTDSNEAYRDYLLGRHYWNKRDGENIKKAIEQFQLASDKDPNFALAYVGLADCFTVSTEYLGTPSSENLPKAMAYAKRALEIDDSLAEAHASLGLIHENSWNWAASESEFKRAIELNPNYPTALHWYSLVLRFRGRPDEALVYIKRAQELDPLSLIISANVVETYLAVGDVDSAHEQAKKLIELEPNNWGPHNRLSMVYLKLGNNSAALAESLRAVELSKRSSFTLGHYGHQLGISGDRAAALEIARELEDRYRIRRHGARDIAVVYAGMGDHDRAFSWLEKDFQDRSSDLIQLYGHFGTEPLRGDPRFKDLLKRMGMPQ